MLEAVAEAGGLSRLALANLVNLLNPQRLVIGGPVARFGDATLAALPREVRRRALWDALAGLTIVSSALGEKAGPIGARRSFLSGECRSRPSSAWRPKCRRSRPAEYAPARLYLAGGDFPTPPALFRRGDLPVGDHRTEECSGMLRLGIVDCDTSHSYQFSRRLNHTGIDSDQWVAGRRLSRPFRHVSHHRTGTHRGISRPCPRCRCHAGGPGGGPDRHRGRRADLVKRGGGASGTRDAVHRGGDACLHRQTTRHHDCRCARAWSHWRRSGTAPPLRLSPALRAGGAQRARRSRSGPSSARMSTRPRGCTINPGLLHYGVHGVEMLYALMGPGCREVSRTAMSVAKS